MEQKPWQQRAIKESIFKRDEIPDAEIERLGFFGKKLYDTILLSTQMTSEDLKNQIESIKGVKESDNLSQKTDFYEKYGKRIIEALNRVGNESKLKEEYKDCIAEFNAILELFRILFIQHSLVPYKELKISQDSQFSPEMVEEQKSLRQNITEARGLIQWYILSQESNRKYLSLFTEKLEELAESIGLKFEARNVLRGIVQEIGIYKMLKRIFAEVSFATPEEDARYKIDFFAKTKSGKNIIVQSKSQSPIIGMGHRGPESKEGFFDEDEINRTVKKLEEEKSHILINTTTAERSFDSLTQMKGLQEDIGIVKEYAKEKGIHDPHYYLAVARPYNFYNFDAWDETPWKLTSLENQMKIVAQD